MPWCTTPRHFCDKIIYIGINYNLKLYTHGTDGPKMTPGSELVARPGFYQRDAEHSAVFATATCPSVCLSHAGIVSKRLNLS